MFVWDMLGCAYINRSLCCRCFAWRKRIGVHVCVWGVATGFCERIWCGMIMLLKVNPISLGGRSRDISCGRPHAH